MMRRRLLSRSPLILTICMVLLAVLVVGMTMLFASSTRVEALPEYALRTGESCAACHVNPGGGGPRTLRGLLWSARGRPDAVPELPGMLIAPRVTDKVELYEIACAGCHGYKAEGLSAFSLVNTNISWQAIETFTLKGIPTLGMPGFEGQFTDEQLATLVTYMADISSGKALPPSDSFSLPPVQFRCGTDCGTLSQETGGN